MKNTSKCAGLLLSFITTSCATYTGDTSPGPYGPKASSKGTYGSVAYNPDGLREIVDMRREDAYKKIFTFCGSNDYTIVKDTVTSAKTATVESIATIGAKNLRELQFECN